MLISHQEICILVFISCFTISVTPSINTPESFSDFMILRIFSLIFFWQLYFIEFKKIESGDATKYNTIYSNSKAEIIIDEVDIGDVF